LDLLPDLRPLGHAVLDRHLHPHLLLDHAVEQLLAALGRGVVGAELLGQRFDAALNVASRDGLAADPHQHLVGVDRGAMRTGLASRRPRGARPRRARGSLGRGGRRAAGEPGACRREPHRDPRQKPRQPSTDGHARTTHTLTVAVTPPKKRTRMSYLPSCLMCSSSSIERRSIRWPALASASAMSVVVTEPNNVSSSFAWLGMLISNPSIRAASAWAASTCFWACTSRWRCTSWYTLPALEPAGIASLRGSR